MPKPLTLYKDGAVQGNVYPSELWAWEENGWSLNPSSTPAISTEPVIDDKPVEEETPLLNINSATAEEISEALNGIGPSRAKKIVQKRKSLDGGFQSVEDIPFLEEDHKALITL